MSLATDRHDPPPTAAFATPAPTRIGPTTFAWGARTFVMGILNVTPDSFSGDGLLARPAERPDRGRRARPGRRMVDEGADLLDVGGESTRPGHAPVDAAEEMRPRRARHRRLRDALPDTPISIDTTKPAVAEAALAAGAHLLNDVWGTGRGRRPGAARRGARRAARSSCTTAPRPRLRRRSSREVVADLERALERALRGRRAGRDLIVDPGIGFGKTADAQRRVLRHLGALERSAGRSSSAPRASRPSAGSSTCRPRSASRRRSRRPRSASRPGSDIVRVHDVAANVRAARVSDAIVRGRWRADAGRRAEGRPTVSDRIVLTNMRFEGRHGYYEHELEQTAAVRGRRRARAQPQPAGIDDDLAKTVDYGRSTTIARQIVESTSFRLLEALAEAISHEVLADFDGQRGRRPRPQAGGPARRPARLRGGRDLAPPSGAERRGAASRGRRRAKPLTSSGAASRA